MEIFDHISYKAFVLARVKAMPRNGHGQFMKISQHLGVSPVVITQTFRGERDLNEEQGLKLANFFGLSSLETDYFMRLIALERAGTHELKLYHREALRNLKKQSEEVRSRVGKFRELDDATKAVFYSEWVYSAARLLTSIDDFRTPDKLAERLNLGLARINEIVEFLISVGLCERAADGRLKVGVATTHIDSTSRFVNSHRRNWRLKGLESLNKTTPDELFYSAPCTISKEDFQTIKAVLLDAVATLAKKIPETDPEFLACINIDWFKV